MSKGKQKSTTGTGYTYVSESWKRGVHVGYVTNQASLPRKVFRISGIGLRGKITEYKTAKQALIAAATHVAVAERQQMDV